MTVPGRRARRPVQQQRRVMGSDAHLVVVPGPDLADPADLLAGAWARIDELERRWSRFLPGSEVSALNRHSGAPLVVSGDTFGLVEHALVAWELTAGRFDPTVGAALAAHGYDRDIDEVRRRHPVPDRHAGPAPGLAGTELDRGLSAVMLPAGVSFDPGGIGKGLAADLVALALLRAGAAGALVNLGGDLRAVGEPPDAGGWAISVPDPRRPERELARLALTEGAVATTSRLQRRWRTTDGEAHHLIDPATGHPADSGVVAVTVVADCAWWAEALTKTVFLAGPDELARHPGTHGIVVTADGRRRATPALRETLR